MQQLNFKYANRIQKISVETSSNKIKENFIHILIKQSHRILMYFYTTVFGHKWTGNKIGSTRIILRIL